MDTRSFSATSVASNGPLHIVSAGVASRSDGCLAFVRNSGPLVGVISSYNDNGGILLVGRSCNGTLTPFLLSAFDRICILSPERRDVRNVGVPSFIRGGNVSAILFYGCAVIPSGSGCVGTLGTVVNTWGFLVAGYPSCSAVGCVGFERMCRVVSLGGTMSILVGNISDTIARTNFALIHPRGVRGSTLPVAISGRARGAFVSCTNSGNGVEVRVSNIGLDLLFSRSSKRCGDTSRGCFSPGSFSRHSIGSLYGRLGRAVLRGCNGGEAINNGTGGVPIPISGATIGGKASSCSNGALTGHLSTLCPSLGPCCGRGFRRCNRFLPSAFFARRTGSCVVGAVHLNVGRSVAGLFEVLGSVCRGNAGSARDLITIAVLNSVGGSPIVLRGTGTCVYSSVESAIVLVGGFLTSNDDGGLHRGLGGPPPCGPGGGGDSNVVSRLVNTNNRVPRRWSRFGFGRAGGTLREIPFLCTIYWLSPLEVTGFSLFTL